MTDLLINSIFQLDDSPDDHAIYRILHVDVEYDELIAIHIYAPDLKIEHWSLKKFQSELGDGNLHFFEYDPYPIESKKPKPRSANRRDAAYELIKPIVDPEDGITLAWLYPSERSRLIQEAIKIWQSRHPGCKTKPSKVTVYKHLRRWAQRGQHPNALLPDNLLYSGKRKDGEPRHVTAKLGRPSPTGINKTEHLKMVFLKGLNRFLRKPEDAKDPNSKKVIHLKKVWGLIRKHYYKIGEEIRDGVLVPILPPEDELPSDAMFYKMWGALPALERAKWKISNRVLRMKHHRKGKRSAKRAFGAGSIYQTDATIIDCIAVSLFDRGKIVKRFTLYLIVDVYSHMIVGFYIGYEREHWFGYALAFATAAADKVKFCAEYGIEISSAKWPVLKGTIPWSAYADRGPMISKASSAYTDYLHIRLTNAPPYRADMKGLVESLIEWMNKHVFDECPGAVPEKIERGDPKYRLNARLNITELKRLIILAILYHNQHLLNEYPEDLARLNAGIPKVPLELWKYSITNVSGLPRKQNRDEIYMYSLPTLRLALLPEGLKLKKLYFTTDWIEKYTLRDEAALPGVVRRYYEIAFDPRSTRKVFLKHEDGHYEQCIFVQKDQEELFGDADFAEVDAYFKAQDELDKQYSRFDDEMETELEALSDRIKSDAMAATDDVLKETTPSKTSRLKGAAAQHEQDRHQLNKLTRSQAQEPAQPSVSDPQPANPATTSNIVKGPNRGSLLRRIRDEREKDER